MGCQISCKDTNLKAIHNEARLPVGGWGVAKSPAKIQIWKQFTTNRVSCQSSWKLPNLLQRYKFESNSQHHDEVPVTLLGCQISCKDTNLKAIHNRYGYTAPCSRVAKSPAKIQIWKQFTTVTALVHEFGTLPNLLQRYKFESNSQQLMMNIVSELSCQISCKDTNLKAIHNIIIDFVVVPVVAKSPAKIQIWKQFTTNLMSLRKRCWLPNLLQRYKFESNSQQPVYKEVCIEVAKSPAKIQIWKQFTTTERIFAVRGKVAKFESNSQRLPRLFGIFWGKMLPWIKLWYTFCIS